ncbi:MAG: hypothetical protein IJ287_03300 [Methanobrevibacter sp.]|jgi:predicted DNA-binding protein|nr:hypothetical protein [Methanobrevibacter sp.]MBR1748908.1 hypothetical protein [Bacilli bacterium]
METTKLIIEMPKELKTELNLIAVKKGTTMKNIVTQLIQDYVEENK